MTLTYLVEVDLDFYSGEVEFDLTPNGKGLYQIVGVRGLDADEEQQRLLEQKYLGRLGDFEMPEGWWELRD